MSPTALLESALAAAGRGWHVFPLRPGEKRPAIRDWERRATVDPDRITRCWTAGGPAFNIGIACGPSGLVVIDLDPPKPGQETPPETWRLPGVRDGADVFAVICEHHGPPLPLETFITDTARGGMHLYYRQPPGPPLTNTAGRLGWLVDTRAHGGYVLAPGSVTTNGTYTVIHDTDPAPLPTWLLPLLATNDPDRTDTASVGELLEALARRSSYTAAALRGELERVLAAQPGDRNHTLNAAAYALGQLVAVGFLPYDLAAEALDRAATAIGLPPRERAATIRSGLKAGARCPRSVPA